MLTAMADGLVAVLSPQALAFMTIGVVYGIIIGILPGMGGIIAMALLLPFTWGYEPAATLSLLLGAHIASIWGGSVTAILFKVPGSGKNLATLFDGYPMAQRGEATRALCASAMAALMGGLIGAVVLAVSIPLVRPVIFALGPSEYLMMAIWGLTVVASFSEGTILKGMIAACFGVLVAFIGMDIVTATPRYTFDIPHLIDGLSFPVVVIGMFAIPEMMNLFAKPTTLKSGVAREAPGQVWRGVRDVFVQWATLTRSSILGVWIGILPGIGANVGGIAAYAQEVKSARDKTRFGKGDVRGVIAPDATLGANEGGGLVPTLAFGIPGGESMAILLIAFVGMNIIPGPQMLTTNLDIVFSMVWIIIAANVMITAFALAAASYLARIRTLSNNLIIPLVLVICTVAAFASENIMADVLVSAFFGLIGCLMERYRYSRANFVIGMVLALMIERNLHLSLSLYGPDFLFTRPITLVMLIIILVTTLWPVWTNWRRSRATGPATEATVQEGGR